jgi:hypothetical protein
MSPAGSYRQQPQAVECFYILVATSLSHQPWAECPRDYIWIVRLCKNFVGPPFFQNPCDECRWNYIEMPVR